MKSIKLNHLRENSSVQNLGIYKSALEIFTLSRKLSRHQSKSLRNVNDNLISNSHFLFEEITTNAVSIPFSIAEATVTNDFTKKIHSQKVILRSLELLKKSCKQLSIYTKSGELDGISIALLRFEKKYHIWSVQLTRQN